MCQVLEHSIVAETKLYHKLAHAITVHNRQLQLPTAEDSAFSRLLQIIHAITQQRADIGHADHSLQCWQTAVPPGIRSAHDLVHLIMQKQPTPCHGKLVNIQHRVCSRGDLPIRERL